MPENQSNYRFNIAKLCCICGKSFITDIFDEKDMCHYCEDIYRVVESNEDESLDRDYLGGIMNSGCRTKAIRYD